MLTLQFGALYNLGSTHVKMVGLHERSPSHNKEAVSSMSHGGVIRLDSRVAEGTCEANIN
jgi:hypothetical protein